VVLRLRQKPLQRAAALDRDPNSITLLLDKTDLLHALKRDPIQLPRMELAVSDVAEGLSFGSTEGEGGVSMGGGLRRARFPRTVAAWRTINVDEKTNSMNASASTAR
jgi:hypothetical protein